MKDIKNSRRQQRRYRFNFTVLLFVLSLLFFAVFSVPGAEAHNSKAWQKRLAAHTATLWIEGQSLGDVILYSRAQLDVTWLPRSFAREADRDSDVDEWVLENLSYYFSRFKDRRAKVKGRDILVLNYRALKTWTFDPTKLIVNGYQVTKEDILTKEEYQDLEELPPEGEGSLAVCVPALKNGRDLELQYDDATATLRAPKNE
ncbi:MAG: hypothetical protein LBR61_05130 [Synergistaceae bacterium]|jgi:hypothetical protein|nr:hypothetical protein [Synergistaceae bacterium]